MTHLLAYLMGGWECGPHTLLIYGPQDLSRNSIKLLSKGVSLYLRGHEEHGPKHFFGAMPPDPHY